MGLVGDVLALRRDSADCDSEPCIRGHRSTKCEHFDRFMLRVKKPGRPLSTCPHPKNSCSCGQERIMMVRIPKGMADSISTAHS